MKSQWVPCYIEWIFSEFNVIEWNPTEVNVILNETFVITMLLNRIPLKSIIQLSSELCRMESHWSQYYWMEFHITSSMLYWMDLQWIQCYWIESHWSQCYERNFSLYQCYIEWNPTEVNVIVNGTSVIAMLLNGIPLKAMSYWAEFFFISMLYWMEYHRSQCYWIESQCYIEWSLS